MKKAEIYGKLDMSTEIAELLALEDFSPIYEEADRVRREVVGDTVHLRAIIEFSNVCRRQCRYCGLNCHNKELPRYRMSHEEILQTAKEAVAAGYRTIVLQSGEDSFFTAERLGEIISDIKQLELPMPDKLMSQRLAGISCNLQHPAVTVSCGERPPEDYRHWRQCGADRYLLKHEIADHALYDELHPCGTLAQRIDCLKTLYRLGYETGSGFMVGLPGQTLETLGRDLLLLKEIPCHMAGIGPFIVNPKTPLGEMMTGSEDNVDVSSNIGNTSSPGVTNGDPELTRRCVAIARLLLPEANLPLTTALSIVSEKEKAGSNQFHQPGNLDDDGAAEQTTDRHSENPFAFGANVIMKKVTPDKYKSTYEIYPADFQPTNIAEDRRELEQLIRYYGRVPL